MSTWYHTDVDSPEYQATMRKVMQTQPEVSALAARIFGDEVLKKAEEAGINRDITLRNLAIGQQKVDLAKEKLTAAKEVGTTYNELLKESHGLKNWEAREKLALTERQTNTANVLGGVGAALSAYTGYQKMQLADKLSKDERIKYLLGR